MPAGHGEVMHGADEPPEVTIEMHLELSYNLEMPNRIYFYCTKVAATIIACLYGAVRKLSVHVDK